MHPKSLQRSPHAQKRRGDYAEEKEHPAEQFGGEEKVYIVKTCGKANVKGALEGCG